MTPNSDSDILIGQVADAVSTALLLTTTDGRTVWHNKALTDLLGETPLKQLAMAGVRPGGPTVDLAPRVMMSGPGSEACSGKWGWVRVASQAIGEFVLYEISDITEVKNTQNELTHLADHDPLTGLVNRHAITSRLSEVLCETKAGGLLLIDVDNFKDINDVRGHAIGDEVMRALAHILLGALPQTATLGRFGGDEFAVVLSEGDAEYALALAEALCGIVAKTPLPVFDDRLRVTLSIGAAPAGGERDCEVLIANADVGLYEAKTAGRNRARLFTPEQYRQTVQRVNVVRRVRDAMDEGRLELDAQPIVDLATGKTSSYELLVRLRDGMYPTIGPAEFVPPLERGDCVRQLDRWVVEEATTALATRFARTAKLHLDVNVSSRSMDDPSFGDWVVGRLHDLNIEPPRLGLEITETTAISNLVAARHLAETLTAAGCRFSLDDFGAGFGSFVYLKNLPFTTVKIAGEFVRQADTDGVDAVLVDAVVRAATGLGMTTVAEYVDRKALVEALQRLGVDRGQGYHLGRPTPLHLLIGKPNKAGSQPMRASRAGEADTVPIPLRHRE